MTSAQQKAWVLWIIAAVGFFFGWEGVFVTATLLLVLMYLLD